MTTPGGDGMLDGNRHRFFDGAVWHVPMYAATMFGELNRGRARAVCGELHVVRAVCDSMAPEAAPKCRVCK